MDTGFAFLGDSVRPDPGGVEFTMAGDHARDGVGIRLLWVVKMRFSGFGVPIRDFSGGWPLTGRQKSTYDAANARRMPRLVRMKGSSWREN